MEGGLHQSLAVLVPISLGPLLQSQDSPAFTHSLQTTQIIIFAKGKTEQKQSFIEFWPNCSIYNFGFVETKIKPGYPS